MATLEEVLADITDTRSLRSKRGARKGNLKRLSNYFNSAEDIPLERQRLSDLEKRLNAVAENILAYDLIQNRLEEVAGAPPSSQIFDSLS